MAPALREVFLLVLVSAFCAVSTAGNDGGSRRVKRESARMLTVDLGSFSECSVTCGGGVRVRTALCRDQDDVLFPICPPGVTDNCCRFVQNVYFNGSGPFWYERCGMTPCPGMSLPPNGFTPHSTTVSHDGANTLVTVTTGSDTASVSTDTTVSSNVQINFTAITNFTSGRGLLTTSDAYIPDSASISSNTLVIGGQSILAADSFQFIRTLITSDTSQYMMQTATYNPEFSSLFTEHMGITDYYYISPLGMLYRFRGNKMVIDTGNGIFFLRRSTNPLENIVIYSQNGGLSNFIRSLASSQFSVIPGNGNVDFNFAGAGVFVITGSTMLNRGSAPVSFSGGSLTVGSTTVGGITRLIRAGEGLESYTSSENVTFRNYDSYFINGRNAIFSTNAMLSQMTEQVQMYLAAGNTPQADFTVVGNTVQYSGFTVMMLVEGMTENRSFSGPALVNYVTQQIQVQRFPPINFTPMTGVAFLAANLTETNFIFNGAATAIAVPPGTAARIFRTGNSALVTTSPIVIARIDAAFAVQTTPVSTAVFTTVNRNNNYYLQLNGEDIFRITGATASISLRAGDQINYSGGTISIIPADSRGPFSGISKMTVIRSGSSDIEQYSSVLLGRSFNVDASYLLAISSNGQALLTNNQTVLDLIGGDAVLNITTTRSNGQIMLFVGGNLVYTVDSTTDVLPVTTNNAPNRIRLLGNTITANDRLANILFQRTVNSAIVFNRNMILPQDLGTIMTSVETNVYITGGAAFVTDRQSVIDMLNFTLATTAPTPTPAPTATRVVETSTPSPTPTPELETITTDNRGNPSLTIDGTNVMILTGSSQVDVTDQEEVTFMDRIIVIRRTGDGSTRLSVTNIQELGVYMSAGNLQMFTNTAMQTFSGPGTILYNQISEQCLYTNQPSVTTLISMTSIPSMLPAGIITRNGQQVLTLGGAEAITLTGANRTSVTSNQMVTINSTGYTIFNADGSVARTVMGSFNRLIQYYAGMAGMQNLTVTDLSSEVTVTGPQTLVSEGSTILVTNRSEVSGVISGIITSPSLNVTFRMMNGETILVIGGQDIITISQALVHTQESYEFSTYSNSIANNTNVVTGLPAGAVATDKFTVYTPTDNEPVSFFGSAGDRRIFGPGLFYFTANESFIVTRPDIVDILIRMFNQSSTPEPPPPPAPPQPGEEITPIPQEVLNSDGSEWTTSRMYTPCSRGCGGGVQVRLPKCESPTGHVTTCTDPTEPSSRFVPSFVRLCNTQSCTGGSFVTVPMQDVFDVTFRERGNAGSIYGYGTVIVSSNVNNDSYIVRLMATCFESGSTYVVNHERANGATASKPYIQLSTTYNDLTLNSTVSPGTYTITHMLNGVRIPITVVPINGQPADECFTVNDTLIYSGDQLSFNNMTVSGINMLRRLDRERSVMLPGPLPAPFNDTGPLYLCVKYSMGSAVYTKDFITEMMRPYNMLVATLRGPMIQEGVEPPDSVVDEAGGVFQVGTTPISVLEEIHTISLRCMLSDVGNPPVTSYVWRKDGQIVPNDNVNYQIFGDRLTIRTTDDDMDEGLYTCSVSNGIGTDMASTFLNITQEIPITTTAPPPTPPPVPMWVAGPFGNCHKRCNVGVKVRSVECYFLGQPSTACNVADMPLSFQLCNIEDCPELNPGTRDGIPENENITFVASVFNGNFEVLVTVSLSSNLTGSYQLDLMARYPDGTIITNSRTRMNFMPEVDTKNISFGVPLFGKLQAIRTINRIDILSQKIVSSFEPFSGDICYPYGVIDQFIFDNKNIISASLRQRTVGNINSVVYINHQGVFHFDRFDTKLFQGPQLVCTSSFYGRAFVTNVVSLAEDITGHYYNISRAFTPPVIEESNGTLFLNDARTVGFVELGRDISAVNGSFIRVRVSLANPGIPQAHYTEWRLNGEVITTDAVKGRFISSNGFELNIIPFAVNHAGTYTFTVRNGVGFDTASTDISYRPDGFGIIIAPVTTSEGSSVLNVGIGLNYAGVNATQVRTVRVTCPTTTNSTSKSFQINGGSSISTDILTHDLGGTPSDCIMYTCTASNGSVTALRNSMVCFETPSAPTVSITGRTFVFEGQSTLLTCSASGYPPPTVLFDTIMVGSNNVISNYSIFTNGSILIYNARPNDITQYCCGAVNSVNTTRACATIQVMTPPMITRVPPTTITNGPLPPGITSPSGDVTFHIGQNAQILQGTTVFIQCNATGSPAPSYEWAHNGVILTGSEAMSPVLMLDLIVPENAGTYRCTIRNINGSDFVESSLSVIRPPSIPDPPVNFTEVSLENAVIDHSQSSNVTVTSGLSFCVRCVIADPGLPPVTEIHWERENGEGIDITDICLDISENGTLLCFTEISVPYSGTYGCRVANIAGSDSGSVHVRVAVAPRIRRPVHEMLPDPSSCDHQEDRSFVNEDIGVNLCLSVGARVLLDCVVEEDTYPVANITWSIRGTGQVLSDSDSGITIFPNNSLLIQSISMGTNTYVCTAANFAGSASRESVITATGVAPSIRTTSSSNEGRRRIIDLGTGTQYVRLQRYNETLIVCNADGRPSPQVTWTVGGEVITSGNRAFMIQEDGSLLISGLQTTACALYTCTASNAISSVSRSVTVCGETFQCFQTGLSECTTTCGLGARRFIYSCNRTRDTTEDRVPLASVPISLRPRPQATFCLSPNPPCRAESFRYVPTSWSSCSHSCGCGRRSRSVQCYLFSGDFQIQRVELDNCLKYANQSGYPANLTEDCNTYDCPIWYTGEWSECDRICSEGNRTRNVTCISPANNNMTIDDRFCNNRTCPISRELCNNGYCPYIYTTSLWTPCSTTCRGGFRTRSVTCFDVSSGQVIAEELCVNEGLDRPISMHACGVGDCLSPRYTWVTGEFGPCNTTCGDGYRTRAVECQDVITQNRVPDNICLEHGKPSSTRPCNLGHCPNSCGTEPVLCRLVALSTATFCSIPAVRGACCRTCG